MDKRICGLFYFIDQVKSLLITGRDSHESIIPCLSGNKYVSSVESDNLRLLNKDFSGILETSDAETMLFLVNSMAHSFRIKRFLKKNGLEYISACLIVPSFRNPRWVLPLHKHTIGKSTRIIKPSKLKSIIAYKLLLFLNLFGCPQLVFPCQLIIARKAGTNISVTGQLTSFLIKKLGIKDLHIILYTGSPGVYQKFTVQVMDGNGNTVAYAKIGKSELAKKTIEDEIKTLQYLERISFETIKHPEMMVEEKLDNTQDLIMLQTPAPGSYRKFQKKLSDNHIEALAELFAKTEKQMPGRVLIGELEKEFFNIKDKIVFDKGNYCRLFESVLQMLKKTIGGRQLTLGFSHGDFAPWNMFAGNSGIFVFDWENSRHRVPMWDFYNFIFHVEVLIYSRKHDDILNLIYSSRSKYAALISRYKESFSKDIHLDDHAFLVITLYQSMLYYIEYSILQKQILCSEKSSVKNLLNEASAMLWILLRYYD